MIDFREPVYQMEYQKMVISIYAWGNDHVFFAQMHDKQGQPVGAAPKFYTSVDAAINVCKDLLDFLYGTVDSYQERPEPTTDFEYTSPARQTTRLVWAS